jgi:2-oxoglutarate ferredoxin oxidoreductase subunit alpha
MSKTGDMLALSIKIGAQAGAGVMVTGRSLAKCFTRNGLNVVAYPEYPSIIRGGHNSYQVVISEKPVHSPLMHSDIVVALNQDAVLFHKDSISKEGALIYDSRIDARKFKPRKDILLFRLPIEELLAGSGATAKMANTVALGAALALSGYPFGTLETVLRDEFTRKGENVVKENISAAKAGYDHAKANFKGFGKGMRPISGKRKIFVAGNEAMALGAVKAGMKFYVAYPMTPASTILHYLCENERSLGLVVKQTEDEIAAMNYAVGANFAGVRAMTGTSGGGFSLMVEALGQAAESETPVVVTLVSRPGPGTGMPTWTEQAELRFALHASQGEFLRVILAPGDVDECFELAWRAFNFADKYQIPVIMLSDKFLGESTFSTERFDESRVKIERGKIAKGLPALPPNTRFKRYALSADGVSPRPLPGEPGGVHVASSYEHDETGYSSEDFSTRKAHVDKRMAKLGALLKEIPGPKLYGPKAADVTLVCWGSQKLPCLDSLDMLAEKGVKANMLHFSYMFPINAKEVQKTLAKCKKTVLVENNATAQLSGLLREYAGAELDFHLLKYDGRQFFPEQVAAEVAKLAEKGFGGKKEIRIGDSDYEYYDTQRYGL